MDWKKVIFYKKHISVFTAFDGGSEMEANSVGVGVVVIFIKTRHFSVLLVVDGEVNDANSIVVGGRNFDTKQISALKMDCCDGDERLRGICLTKGWCFFWFFKKFLLFFRVFCKFSTFFVVFLNFRGTYW